MIPLYSDGHDRGGATWRPYKAPTQSSKSAKKELLFLRCAPSIKLVARQNRCTVGMKRYRFGIGDRIVLRENIACSYIPRRSPYGLNHFVLYIYTRRRTQPAPNRHSYKILTQPSCLHSKVTSIQIQSPNQKILGLASARARSLSLAAVDGQGAGAQGEEGCGEEVAHT
jgi:hypothetical protein